MLKIGFCYVLEQLMIIFCVEFLSWHMLKMGVADFFGDL